MYRPSILTLLAVMAWSFATGQVKPAPDRTEGSGPYAQLIIRGATLINGTGSPPYGPVDIVIENNRITAIKIIGSPGVIPPPEDRPVLKANGYELDANGMYILPGFIDMHGHIGGEEQGADAEYVFKLWMAHGITTIRDPGSGNGLDWVCMKRNAVP